MPPSPLIDHPTGATDVVLRMSVGGGLRYPGATLEEPPRFTLYGDGRVIYTMPAPAHPERSARFDLHQARLDEAQMGSLLQFALGDAGLAVARARYADVPIADDATTTFEIHGGGFDKTVAVYALGYTEEGVPDLQARARLQALADQLAGFGELVAQGGAVDLGSFEPAAYQVTLDQPFGPLVDKRPIAWPWLDLTLEDFGHTQAGWWTAIVTADHAKQLADPVNTAPDDLVVLAPDDNEYLLRIRPLLPDELP